MGNKNNQEKYSKLSIASLITGIVSYICILLMWLIFEILLRGGVNPFNFNEIIITILTFAVFGLAIAAIVCGSIDLHRIKRGQYSSKGKGFDITGIVLGSVFILAVIYLVMIDLIDKINGE